MKIRYRTLYRFGKPALIVLQVEVTESANEGHATFTAWRDATPDDLLQQPEEGK